MRAVSKHIAVLALFGALSVAMTWPLAANLTLATAHPGDPYINAWILDWVWHAMTSDASLWNANIFHPARLTLAFSENLFGIALLMAPFLASDLSRLTIVNIAMLIGFATAGYAAALLGRHLTQSWTSGIAAGVFFAFVPWRLTHLTHLQHEWTLWLPLALLALLRLRERTSIANAALLFVAMLMNGLTNLHWFAFGSVALGVIALVIGRERRFFALAASAAIASLLAMIPVLLPYREAQSLYAMRGSTAETAMYSARASDWLLPSLHNRIYGPLNDGTVDPERWLFPGLLAIVLALVALRAKDRAVLIGLTLIAIGFIGSLGLNALPGRLLFEHVPLFQGIRVPARWAMITYLGLACLIAIAVARMRWQWITIALLLVELNAAPIRWYLTPGETPPVYAWLAQHPNDGPIIEVPLEQEPSYAYMLHATTHHRPLMNGVSGFRPPLYASLQQQWSSDPMSFLDTIKRSGATTIVVHGDDSRVREWQLPLAARFDRTSVYTTHPRTPYIAPPSLTGELLQPQHWQLIDGPLRIEGRARGPHPIVRVDLFFDNRQERIPARIEGDRFIALIRQRPDFIRADTDLQVEITDARANVVRLPQVWLRWKRAGDRLRTNPLPQTADLGAYVVKE